MWPVSGTWKPLSPPGRTEQFFQKRRQWPRTWRPAGQSLFVIELNPKTSCLVMTSLNCLFRTEHWGLVIARSVPLGSVFWLAYRHQEVFARREAVLSTMSSYLVSFVCLIIRTKSNIWGDGSCIHLVSLCAVMVFNSERPHHDYGFL